MAQEFTPQRNQSAAQQMQMVQTPGPQSSGGSGQGVVRLSKGVAPGS
jgi:hypothetical protein